MRGVPLKAPKHVHSNLCSKRHPVSLFVVGDVFCRSVTCDVSSPTVVVAICMARGLAEQALSTS
eukprot:6469315-Amphidinium_carterae.1